MTSPTQLSLKHLRKEGHTVAIVEHWNPHAFVRQDLFGFIDILVLTPDGILGVQTTSYKNMSARVKKIRGSLNYSIWKGAGGKICVHGWKKVKSRWKLTERDL